MYRALSLLVLVFGLVCCLIAAAHIALGPRAIIGSVPVNATMDGEDRFFASLFLGFGATLTWCSRDLIARRRLFGALLLVFFVGGLARVLAAAETGWPHPLFIGLGLIELVLPPALWIWLRAETKDGA